MSRLKPTRRDDGLDSRLIPPGVRDERSQAFAEMLAAAGDKFRPKDVLLTDYQTVDARLLPALVRGLSLQEFMYEGIAESRVRAFLGDAIPLHQKKGTVEGVRFALRLLGVTVDWQQWWQASPPGAPNTHTVTAFVSENLFEDEPDLLSARQQSAILTIIDATKRWSQKVTFQIGVAAKGTLGLAGAVQSLMADRVLATVPADTDHAGVLGLAGAVQLLSIDRVVAQVPAATASAGSLGLAGTHQSLMADRAICRMI